MASYDFSKFLIITAIVIITLIVIISSLEIGDPIRLSCVDNDKDTFATNCVPRDCSDTNPKVFPGAQELCFDGLDNNCNGQFDESCPYCSGSATKCYQIKYKVFCNKQDGCYWNLADGGKCKGVATQCFQITNEARCENQMSCTWHKVCTDLDADRFYKEGCGSLPDCNDEDALTYPQAPEICDLQDNNCNSLIDDAIYCPKITIGPEGLSGRSTAK